MDNRQVKAICCIQISCFTTTAWCGLLPVCFFIYRKNKYDKQEISRQKSNNKKVFFVICWTDFIDQKQKIKQENAMLDYLRQIKQCSWAAPVLCAVFIFLLMWIIPSNTPAYVLLIDGEEKFVVKNPEEVNQVLKEIEIEREEKHQQDLKIYNQLDFKRVFVSSKSVITAERLKQELEKNITFSVKAAAILVDGKTVACVQDRGQAEELLEKLKKEYSQVDEGEKLLAVSFAEDVRVKEDLVLAEDVLSNKEAYDLITTGTKAPEKYTVKEGDCLWLIARKNDMYVEDIVQANKLETENLSPGQELILVKSKPYINVIAEVEGEKVEKIPYETRVVVDENSYTNIKVKQAGQDGERQIVYVATKCNGVVTDREIKEEKILKEAVDRILVKGSKVVQVASRGAAGSLDWPVYGTITQYFKGSSHKGLDIGAGYGTPIKAADSGYVTYAGWLGGYGNIIAVDHGNGIVTRYAHCSSLTASVGQKVARGEVIAKLGNTGRSTGPHLHFEVIVYGSFKNPLDYLR